MFTKKKEALVKDLKALKDIAEWARTQGIQKLDMGAVKIEFAPVAFLSITEKHMQNMEGFDLGKINLDNLIHQEPDES